MQEKEAINELFAGFDYDDEDDETEEVTEENEISHHASSAGLLPSEGLNLKEHLAELEISLINQALEKTEGVVARSAELLGMRRTTLVEKMKKYNLSKE